MDWLARTITKLRLLAGRETFNRELEEEMTFHREEAEKELIDSGMPAGEAHYAAMRRFGNDARLRDDTQQITRLWFESIVQDFRFAMRQLRKNPGFAATAILILTLGIAAGIAIFSFVDAALIKPLPY